MNSDKSRCLTVLVINNVCELIILFFETQIRIFYNFFFKLSVFSLLIVKGKIF